MITAHINKNRSKNKKKSNGKDKRISWGNPGIEPGTSRTLSENYTIKPIPLLDDS